MARSKKTGSLGQFDESTIT